MHFLRAILLVFGGLATFAGSLPGAAAAPAVAAPASELVAPPVAMNPFGVLAEQFEIQAYMIDDHGTRTIDKMLVGPVTKNSLAARAGLREGMNILSLYGVPVSGRPEREFIRDYVARHDPAKLTIVVSRLFGGPRTIEIVWPPVKKPPAPAVPVPAATAATPPTAVPSPPRPGRAN